MKHRVCFMIFGKTEYGHCDFLTAKEASDCANTMAGYGYIIWTLEVIP